MVNVRVCHIAITVMSATPVATSSRARACAAPRQRGVERAVIRGDRVEDQRHAAQLIARVVEAPARRRPETHDERSIGTRLARPS